MTPRKQIFRHDPDNGGWGDCYRTAWACLLDLEPKEVPHFCDQGRGDKESDRLLKEWLAARGLTYFRVLFGGDLEVQKILDTVMLCNPGTFALLSGESRNGTNHIVIIRDGEIVHDPAQDDSGITGPCDNGYFEVMVPVPLAISSGAATSLQGSGS